MKRSTIFTLLIMISFTAIAFAAGGGGSHADPAEAHAEQMKLLMYNAINFILLV